MMISINNDYSCCIRVSNRDIIDIAFKKVIQATASIIASTLSDTELFGKFTAKQLIVIGQFIDLNNSALHTLLEQELKVHFCSA
jgi:hypothetical protein